MNIQDYERKVYSQFGEDGVTLELVERLDPPQFFLEIGSGGGTENNTRVLAERAKWCGLWIDKIPGAPKVLPPGVMFSSFLASVENSPFIKQKVPVEFGVLSIDIDGNDYWLWKALCGGEYGLRPAVCIIEAQTCRPTDDGYVMPYDALYEWDNASRDCGATPSALEALGRELGYTSLGRLSDKHSPNMFFVRNDLVERLDG